MDEAPIRRSSEEALKSKLCTKLTEEEKLCHNLNDEKHDRGIQFEGRKIVSGLGVVLDSFGRMSLVPSSTTSCISISISISREQLSL